MGMNRRSYSHSTASRSTKGIFPSFKFSINGLVIIFLVYLVLTIFIIDILSLCFVNDIDLQLWRANLQLERGYKIPDRIIFEPSVLVYEKSVTVGFHDDSTESVIRLSDEVISSVKKPITTDKQDIYLLASLAQAEAGIEGPEGMRRVVDVVLNRVESRRFPNNVKDVIFQPGQFTTASRLKQITSGNNKSTQIVYSELYGERVDKQSLYFGRSPITTKGLYQFGHHYFSY